MPCLGAASIEPLPDSRRRCSSSSGASAPSSIPTLPSGYSTSCGCPRWGVLANGLRSLAVASRLAGSHSRLPIYLALLSAVFLTAANEAKAHDADPSTTVLQEHCTRDRLPVSTRGIVLWFRGSGWSGHAKDQPHDCTPLDAVESGYLYNSQSFAASGFGTFSVEYTGQTQMGESGGVYAVEDALRAYDELRRLHPDVSICTGGNSSGGHMALVVAQYRPEVACVISEAGITDLAAFNVQLNEQGSAPRRDYVRDLFGPWLDLLSPAEDGGAFNRRPVLLAFAACDANAQPYQGDLFERAYRGAVVHILRPGTTRVAWLHAPGPPGCGVETTDFAAWHAVLQHTLRRLAHAPRAPRPHNAVLRRRAICKSPRHGCRSSRVRLAVHLRGRTICEPPRSGCFSTRVRLSFHLDRAATMGISLTRRECRRLRCTRWAVRQGTPEHSARKDPRTISSLWAGYRLGPGRYQLRVVARLGARRSATVSRHFRVR